MCLPLDSMWILEKIRSWLINVVSSIGLERVASWQNMEALAVWILLQLVVIVVLILVFKLWKKSKFSLIFELFVEKIYEFFEEILEETGKRWIKEYVVTLFFVILLSNLSVWVLDIVRVVFKNVEALNSLIVIPTSSFEFNIAVALVSIVLFLIAQFRYLWAWKFLYEYLPIGGKWILDIDRWEMKAIVYWPAKILAKTLDIAISLFVWLLDIVWVLAKVISLSARLYWNMISWWILLTIMIVWLNELTTWLIGFNFPLIAPLLLYMQGLLVALIQAFVFPLLVGIFMKLAQTPAE